MANPNSILFPTLAPGTLSARLAIDKLAVVVDVPKPKQRRKIDARLGALEQLAKEHGMTKRVITKSDVLKAMRKHYKHRVGIPIPDSHSRKRTGPQGAYLLICWGPTRKNDEYGYVWIQYNPDMLRTEKSRRFVNGIVGDVLGSKALSGGGLRIKRCDFAFDLVSTCFTMENYPLYVKEVQSSKRELGADCATDYFGTRESNWFIRDYAKGTTEDGRYFIRRIEFQRNWPDKTGPSPADLQEWALDELEKCLPRVWAVDVKALPNTLVKKKLMRVLKETYINEDGKLRGYTVTSAVNKMAADRAERASKSGISAKAKARAKERQKDAILEKLSLKRIHALDKEPVRRQIEGITSSSAIDPFMPHEYYPYLKCA